MPNPAQLSEAQRRQIEAEELALAQAAAEQAAFQNRRRAAQLYRQEVREALRPRQWWWPVRWLLPFLPLIAGVAVYFGRPQPQPVTDNTWGGISDSGLMERCRAEVSAQMYGHEPDLRFPTPQEAASQFSANADGKRWDGWAERPDGSHLDFACNFAAADGSVQAEVIR